jgi:GTP-binding protein HflX
LQEATDADVLLHVVDAANPESVAQMAQVQKVLQDIGAADVPQVLVFNKLDAIEKTQWPPQLRDTYDTDGRHLTRVFTSASQGLGLAELRAVLAELAGPNLRYGFGGSTAGQPDEPNAHTDSEESLPAS